MIGFHVICITLTCIYLIRLISLLRVGLDVILAWFQLFCFAFSFYAPLCLVSFELVLLFCVVAYLILIPLVFLSLVWSAQNCFNLSFCVLPYFILNSSYYSAKKFHALPLNLICFSLACIYFSHHVDLHIDLAYRINN